MPEAMLGFPKERKTVSKVRSILRRERVKISCFLGLEKLVFHSNSTIFEAITYFVERFPLLDSSKIHS